jgi:hypothetical protein
MMIMIFYVGLFSCLNLSMMIPCILRLQVDDLLDELCQYTKEDEQTQCLTKIAKRLAQFLKSVIIVSITMVDD